MSNNFLSGAYILSVASFLVKILGFIYVIPFVALLGDQNYVLFEYAYKPYIIILSVATLGIPSAVAKFVSKYHSRGEYQTINRLMKSGFIILSITGILAFLLLFLSAEMVAAWLVGGGDNTGNSIEDVTYVIQMISYALIIVPNLALWRGYTQGFQTMLPTSVSQVLEQVIRIIIILGGSWLIIKVFGWSEVLAVGVSTLAAAISAIVGLLVVFYYIKKNKYPKEGGGESEPLFSIYKEIIVYAIPFIFVGLAIPLIQTIDTFLINTILTGKGFTLATAEKINANVALVQKIAVIPTVISTAFSVAIVSFVTKAKESDDINSVKKNITQSFSSVLFFIIPATVGMGLLSKSIYTTIYGTTMAADGVTIFAWYAGFGLFISLYSISAAMLQGLNKQKWVVFTLIATLALKLAITFPMVKWWDGEGTAISTYVALLFAILLQMYLVQRFIGYRWIENFKEYKTVFVQSVIMGIVVLPFTITSIFVHSYIGLLIILCLGVVAGGTVYGLISYKNKSLFQVISKGKVDKILRRIPVVKNKIA